MRKTINGFVPFRSLDSNERAALDKIVQFASQNASLDYDATVSRRGRFVTYRSEDGSKNVYEVKGLTTIPNHQKPDETIYLWIFESEKESWLPSATVTTTNAAGLVAAFNHY